MMPEVSEIVFNERSEGFTNEDVQISAVSLVTLRRAKMFPVSFCEDHHDAPI